MNPAVDVFVYLFILYGEKTACLFVSSKEKVMSTQSVKNAKNIMNSKSFILISYFTELQ